LRKARRELQEERILTRVSPRPLARDAVAELMRRTPALADRASELTGVMLEQSAGNPLFLGEAIRNHLEGADASPTEPLTSARRVIELRLSRLREASRSLAGAAAVIGQGFNVELVRDVTGWSEGDVVDGLSELLDRHIIKEAGGRSGYAYSFVHHVIQNTIYASVSADERRQRHRRVARVLEDTIGEQRGRFIADVARHYDLGDEPVLAGPAWFEAGRYAATLYAWDEALRHLDRSLELTRDIAVRVQVLLLRESIRARRGDRAGQRADLDELERVDDTSFSADVQFSIVRRRALLARAVGERDREGAFVDELLARAELAGDDRMRAEALVASAGYATLTGDNARARAAAEAAQALYARLGDVVGEMEARCRLVETAYQGGAFELVGPLLAQAREAAQRSGSPALLARAINAATHVAISEQRYPECRELALEARALYRSIGDREAEADAINRQASAAARLSLLTEARQCYAEALAIYEAIGKRLGVASVLANGGIQSVRIGQVDKARDALIAALGHFEALKDVRGQTACNVNLSYVHLLRREASQAKVYATSALAMARSLDHAGYEAASLANLGAAERDLGDLTSALEHMRAGIAIRRKHNEASEYADELGAVALLYVQLGDVAAARAVAQELDVALRSASTMLFMPQTAYWSAAQVFHALVDRRRADEMLDKARSIVADQASAVADSGERGAYLELHVNREIEAAYDRKEWPSVGATTGDGKSVVKRRARSDSPRP
jgi:tetratricopeptide (TPR) repeat protein